MPTKAERAEKIEADRLRLEADLVRIGEAIAKIDADRETKIRTRDEIIRKLGKRPHLYATRRIARILTTAGHHMTYQNVALLITPKKVAARKAARRAK